MTDYNYHIQEITFVSSVILVLSENVISNTLHFNPYLFSHDLSFFLSLSLSLDILVCWKL